MGSRANVGGKGRPKCVVGVGVGRGVRQTFSLMLRRLRCDTGSTYIIVSKEPLPGELFAGAVLPVKPLDAKRTVPLRPHHIYIAPPEMAAILDQGTVRVRRAPNGKPIDALLGSLAQAREFRSAAVLLGDTSSDGVDGLGAVRAAGGTTFVQNLGTHRRQSGIDPDAVDYFPAAADLIHLIGSTTWNFDPDRGSLKRIKDDLRHATGLDISPENDDVVRGALVDRMFRLGIRCLRDYERYSADAPGEARLLARSIVQRAGFFSDPGSIRTLQLEVFPDLVRGRAPSHPVRIWVPDCSTGEAAYGVAMAWLEFTDAGRAPIPAAVIAGEPQEWSLSQAKQGHYPRAIARRVSASRLARFFVKTDTGYEISNEVRRLVTFNRDQILDNAPREQVDLVVGRNLLSSYSPSQQSRAWAHFSIALRPSGYLQISAGERGGAASACFAPVGPGLYRKRVDPADLPARPSSETRELIHQADRLLRRIADPHALVLDSSMTIVEIRGGAAKLLTIQPHQVQLQDAACWPPLSGLVLEALRSNRAAEAKRLRLPSEHDVRAKAVPIASGGCLILLKPCGPSSRRRPGRGVKEDILEADTELQAARREIDRLLHELESGRDALQRVDTFMSNLLHSITLPFIILGQDLTIRFATPEARKIVNVIPSDVGRPIEDLAVNVNIRNLIEKIRDVASVDRNEESSFEVQDPQGRWHLLRLVPCFVEGRKEGVALVLVDIDALRKQRRQLEEAKNFAEAVVQTVRHPLLILDGDLRVRKVNGAFYDTFQTSPIETNGKLIYLLGNGQWNIPRLRTLLESILPSNSSFDDFEVEGDFPRIGRRTMMLSARRICSESSRAPFILLAIEDVTKRKQQEREQRLLAEERAARAAAEENIRLRDEFMSIASHELRTPLTSMQLSLQALIHAQKRAEDSRYPSDQILRMIERCERQGTRLAKLVDNLLDVSRIASRQLTLEREETDFASIVRTVVDRFKPKLEGLKYSIHLDLSSPALGIWDPIRIDQIVTNYLSNAIKYGEGKPIRLRLDQDEKTVTFSVGDRGIGMEAEKLKKLFEPFERLVSVRNYGGLGLGLYIVRQIVEAHGGVVQVQSRVGEGSTFSVTLPKRPDARTTRIEEASQSRQ